MSAVKLLTHSSWFSLFFTWNRNIVDMVTRVFSAWISAILSHFGQIWRALSHLIPPPFYIKRREFGTPRSNVIQVSSSLLLFFPFSRPIRESTEREIRKMFCGPTDEQLQVERCVSLQRCTVPQCQCWKHDLNLPHHPASLPVKIVLPHDFCHPSIFQRPVLPTSGFFRCQEGIAIEPLELFASLVEHMARWGDALEDSFGLCMLEVQMWFRIHLDGMKIPPWN